ncbi:MAG: beta-ketoacyl-[acyl-carrier-protein] synthase family protein [Bacteroidota bacterium]
MTKQNRETICITGMGVISAIGIGVEAFWQALLKGESGAQSWEDLKDQGFRHTSAYRIPSFLSPLAHRGKRMAMQAADEAIQQAGLSMTKRIGVYVGTTMGESGAFEEAAEGQGLTLSDATGISFANSIREAYQLQGPALALGTACAAGNYAIGAGAQAIRRGLIDCAIVGGVDPFSRIAMAGFSRSRAMSPDVAAPFSANRKGMVLGEGAAFLVLEPVGAAFNRGATVWATVESLGLSCDAYHLTAPQPDGTGGMQAMQSALKQANLLPEKIGWICAHGSGTRASDAMEANAISQMFPNRSVAVSGIKGAIGHPLGAATAIEAVATALALHHQILPPTIHCLVPDPACDIHLITKASPALHLEWALNCGYAFGGLNSALLMGNI